MKRSSWKEILAQILREHNDRHGCKDKIVSHITKDQRYDRIFLMFRQLREIGYKLEDPRNFTGKHVRVLVNHWIEIGYAPGTIQTRLSHLRVFARWIGKPGLVGHPTQYVDDPKLVKRSVNATADLSWSARNVDIARVLRDVYAVDRYVGNQLLGELLFGFRVKEAVMFKPHRDDRGDSIWLISGTKGGREREVKVEYPEQREVLERWKQQCSKRHSLSDPQLSLKSAIHRYYSVMRRCGINKKTLGVTSHGLRKEFANLRYADFAGVPSPIRGGPKIDREADREARVAVMEELGHSREQIGGAYLGGILRHIHESATATPPAGSGSAAVEQPVEARGGHHG